MRILFLQNGTTGIFYHRQFVPHVVLAQNHEGVKVDRTDSISEMKNEELEKYDIVQLHGVIDQKIIDRLKRLGKKIVYDVDDLWYCTPDRQFYFTWKIENRKERVEQHIKDADLVTCTTDILKHYIARHTGRVAHVLPNCISTTDEQWTVNKSKSERLRFGFIGGSSHTDDVKLLQPAIRNLYIRYPELRKYWQIIYCGFDWNETRVDQRGNRLKLKTKERNCVNIEKALSLDHSLAEPEHRRELLQFSGVNIESNDNYKRIWTLPISKYASHYNNVDVSLAALKYSTFNICKSNLKTVEAGVMNTPLIASNNEVYDRSDTVSEIMLCSSTQDWLTAMLQHIENFMSTGEPVQSNLKYRVELYYDPVFHAKIRFDLYNNLLKK